MSEVIMKRLLSIFFLCMAIMNLTVNAMQKEESYYEILGVRQGATAAEISKAFRKLAAKYHSDKNSDETAAGRIRSIVAAYDILKDGYKRDVYDRCMQSGTRFEPSGEHCDICQIFVLDCDSNKKFTNEPAPCCGETINLCNDCCANKTVQCPHTRCSADINITHNPYGGFNFKKGLSCKFCSGKKSIEYMTPCCNNSLNVCDGCINLHKDKGKSCSYCPEVIIIRQNQFGNFEIKQTFKCDGPGCTKRTDKQHNNPCCIFGNRISLCGTCSAEPQVQCSNCYKNIDIESMNGVTHLKKPIEIKLKRCSGCPAQIPVTTDSHFNPCCWGSYISLCRECLAKSQIHCPDCYKNIMIESKDGKINFKKPIQLKECSGCPAQIPVTTDSHNNPCCWERNISLCGECLAKSQVHCPKCYKNIVIESKDGKINFKKPIQLKKCSACTNQIPVTTDSHNNPCCWERNISLCGECLAKSQVHCPKCYKNIVIESKDGKINFKKPIQLKKCSACTNQIPVTTNSHFNPCCSFTNISLCDTCSEKSQIPCPNAHCDKKIGIERTANGLQYKKLKNALLVLIRSLILLSFFWIWPTVCHAAMFLYHFVIPVLRAH